jgi:inorganic pyrophosphatase
MNIDYISIGRNPPEEVNAIIEVPIGGEPIKYEMDKKAGTLVVDRFLYTPMRYPGNYGFIPHTLSADGDPCDILVANTRPIIPGAIIAVRPIGVLKMTDEGGDDERRLGSHSANLLEDKGPPIIERFRKGGFADAQFEVSVTGASVFTEDAHDSQSYSVPQRQ